MTIELTNASGEFWDAIRRNGYSQESYHQAPQIAGQTLIEIVESWHEAVGLENSGPVDNTQSFYLVLQWDKLKKQYQLFQFPIDLSDPTDLSWVVDGRRLIGRQMGQVLFEWYGLSGGQLKYYPTVDMSIWHSDIFYLEPLPSQIEPSLVQKVAYYFPEKWLEAQEKH